MEMNKNSLNQQEQFSNIFKGIALLSKHMNMCQNVYILPI